MTAWRDISTAPRDGEPFDVAWRDGSRVTDCHWYDEFTICKKHGHPATTTIFIQTPILWMRCPVVEFDLDLNVQAREPAKREVF